MTDIVQRDVRLVVVGGVKARSVVLDDDLAAAVCLSGLDIDMERSSLQLHAVLDRVFHKGLQRQRRHTKEYMRRIKIREQVILMLRLLHCEIRLRMLQLVGKCSCTVRKQATENKR